MLSPDSSSRIRNLVELNIAVLLFGVTALFAKLINLPATAIIFGRAVVAAIAILVYVLIRRIPIRPESRKDFWVLISTGLLLAVHWVTYFKALQVSTVAIGTIALHTYPIITVLVEPLVDRVKLRLTDLLMALIVLVGIVVLVPEFSLESTVTQGILWGIASAVMFTIRNLMVRRHVQRYSGATVMLYQTAVSALVLLPVVASMGNLGPVVENWQKFLLVGTVFTALTQTLYASSLRHLSAKTVSIIASLLPLYSTIFAAIILAEVPSIRTVIGGIIVMGAVLFETLRVASRRGA